MNNKEIAKLNGSESIISKLTSLTDNERWWNELNSSTPPKQALGELNRVVHIKAQYVEYLLDKLFPDWSFVPVDRGVIANSVYYEGLLRVISPINGELIERVGIGAVPIQVKKGSKSMDIENINPMAIQKNLPAAKTYALKNAAKSLGSLFGRHLNRDMQMDFNLYDTEEGKGNKYKSLMQEIDDRNGSND